VGKDAALEVGAPFVLGVGGHMAVGILIAPRQPGGQVLLDEAVQDAALGRAAPIGAGGSSAGGAQRGGA